MLDEVELPAGPGILWGSMRFRSANPALSWQQWPPSILLSSQNA